MLSRTIKHLTPTISMAHSQSTKSSHSHSQLPSPLFSLPAELRLEIYNHLLTLPPSVNSTNDTCLNAVSIAWSSRPSAFLPILATCRRIHHETADLFYSLNRLYITNRQISNISHLHSFFGTVRKERLRGVRDVVLAVATFEVRGRYMHACVSTVADSDVFYRT